MQVKSTVIRFPSSAQEHTSDTAHADFARLVRDALRHLHDPVYLQTHALTRLLTESNTTPLSTGKRLQRSLLDAIAALRPNSTSGDARASRPYELLTLRYVEALEIADVAAGLTVSRREYDREHRQALDAVISLLRDSVAFSSWSPRHLTASNVTMLTRSAGYLPLPLTGFIGREQELKEVRRLIQSARLLTLSGPPGIGKTRLALQVAIELATSSDGTGPDFPDGVFFVPLAAIADSDLVVSGIAQILGVREIPNRSLSEVLESYLCNRNTLLILDNFEHVLEAAPIVTHLLAECPHLTLLVTSRSSLRLSGEHEFVVPSLQVPEHGLSVLVEDVDRSDAVRLYVERAGAANSGFRLTEQNVPAVIEICRRLDGLPLAIELAAARSKVFPPYALLGRLEGDNYQRSFLDLLSSGPRDLPARQQTLRNAIDWSYQLLTLDEQRLFARLSVFAGSWTLEATEAVCVSQDELIVLEGMASLIDKSLVQHGELPDGEARFSMLETIREYSREQLDAMGDEARRVRRHHAEHFLAIAQEAAANLWGPKQAMWLRRLNQEFDNLRVALAWSRDNGEVELALQLGGALIWFWHDGGHWTEARTWLESALALATPDHRTEGRAAALSALGVCRWCLGDFETARSEAEEGLTICRELGDSRGMGRALHGLGVLAAAQGDLAKAHVLIEEGLSLSRTVGDRQFVGLALHNLGMYAVQENDEETARSRIEQSRRVWQELGSTECLSLASNTLGDLARSSGRYAEAIAYYRESLKLIGEAGPRGWRTNYLHNLGYATHHQNNDREARVLFTEALFLCRDLDDRRGVAESVAGLACLLVKARPERTVRLMGAVTVAVEAIGSHLNPSSQAERDQCITVARSQLGGEAFDAAWAQGRSLTLEQAVEDALEECQQLS